MIRAASRVFKTRVGFLHNKNVNPCHPVCADGAFSVPWLRYRQALLMP